MKGITFRIDELRRVEKRGKMSRCLKHAVGEIVQALRQGNIDFAADLSAVKSFISGEMGSDPERYHFREDSKHNERVLGQSVYGILDRLHHDLAMATKTLPMSMMIISPAGIQVRGLSKQKSPTLDMMRNEDRQMRQEVARD